LRKAKEENFSDTSNKCCYYRGIWIKDANTSLRMEHVCELKRLRKELESRPDTEE